MNQLSDLKLLNCESMNMPTLCLFMFVLAEFVYEVCFVHHQVLHSVL